MQEERDNPALEKSYAFALQVVRLVRNLQEKQRELTLSKHLLLSGTSIGAHVEEGVGAQSAADFISEMGIAYKNARQTRYWLRLLHDSQYLDPENYDELLSNCEELLKILGSICKTSKQRRL